MKHNEEVLKSLNAQHWEVKPGKYSYSGESGKEYMVSYNPLAFGYSALWDSEILFNGRISTEVKVGLIKHLGNIFASMMKWQSDQRGRKIGIEADLTRGGIVTGEKKFTMDISYYGRQANVKGERLESFAIQFRGSTEGKMPYEHLVTIDAAGNAYLGYCMSMDYAPILNDMSDIFQSVFK